MSATLLLCVVFVIFTRDMSSVEGRPTIDLSSGDTVVQEGGLSLRGTTTQCYGSLPSFTWEYVFTDGSSSPIQLSGDPVIATTGGSCSSGSSLYTGSVTVNYNVNPAVYGETLHLRLTINNNPSISTTSKGTLSFIALYNLTGTSDIAILGQQFTWTCQMVIPPHETYTIVSFYRNDTKVGSVGNVTNCRGFSINPRYNYSCPSLREFDLIIPPQNMTEEENNTIWRCAYFGGASTYSSVQKKLVIGNKPEVRTATPNPYKVVEGQAATMVCGIVAANPNTDIIWSWIKTDSPDNILHSGPSYTISNIQREQSGRYNCTATNIIGTSSPATVEVDVRYKPEVSTNSSSPYKVAESQQVSMSCRVTAANPGTDIVWSWIKIDNPNYVLHRGPIYTIPKIKREQSGTYICIASNNIGMSTPVDVQVDVQYKPEVSLTPLNPYRVEESQKAVMSCNVLAANPNIDIIWKWIKVDNPDKIIHTEPTYTISNIQRDQSGTYRCTATNSIGTSTPAIVQLDVQYGPSLIKFSQDINTIDKVENQTVGPATCSAICNPICSYRWTGVSTVNSGRLDLGELKGTERGNYTCTASNIVSSSLRILSVTVNYPPTINIFQASGNQIYEEFSQFRIRCNVDSYPKSDISIENIETGKVISSSRSIDSLMFRELSAKCYQTANYTCNSQNFYGSTSSSKLRIYILCRPRSFDSQSNVVTGIQMGKGLNISTQFIGYPPPTMSWSFKTNTSDMPTPLSGEFRTFSKLLNTSTVQAGLTKETMSPEEFGYYTVTATTQGNTYQISTVTYHVIPERKPDSPKNISIDCTFSKARALIKWIPGFDGGAEQLFVVSYGTNNGLQKNTTQISLRSDVTVTGLKDGTLYFFKVIASNRNGEASSEEIHCMTIESTVLVSDMGGIIGGAVGSIFLVIVIVLSIFIKRKYQIKCLERVPNLRKKESEESNRTLELKGKENENSAHYEELKAIDLDQEKSYDVIQSQDENIDEKNIASYESLDLQSRKEENKYEVLETTEDCKDSNYTDSKMRTSANVYINETFN